MGSVWKQEKRQNLFNTRGHFFRERQRYRDTLRHYIYISSSTLVRILMTASSSGLAWIRSVTVRDKFPMFSIFTPVHDDHVYGDGDVGDA